MKRRPILVHVYLNRVTGALCLYYPRKRMFMYNTWCSEMNGMATFRGWYGAGQNPLDYFEDLGPL